MKARRRLSKKLIIYLGAASALITAYLHFGLCPGKLKDTVIHKLEFATNKRILFSKMLYLPFRGLAFDDLVVGNNDGRLLFSAKQFAVDVDVIDFFRSKRIIVKNLFLDHPLYDYSIEAAQKAREPKPAPVMTRMSGQVAVPVASDSKKITMDEIAQGPDAFLPENVYIKQIRIVDGRVRIRKNEQTEPSEEIRAINIKMSFNRPPVISFDGSFDLGKDSYTTVRLDGGWNLDKASYEFVLDVGSRRIPGWLAEYQQKHLVSLQKGRSHLQVRLRSINESLALFDLNAEFQEASLRLQKMWFDGLFAVQAKGLFNFDTHSFDRYQGQLKLENVNVRNISPQITRLDRVKASVRFQPDLLTVEKASGEYQKVKFLLAGQVQSFKEPQLKARIEVNSSIEEILNLFPAEEKKLLKSFEVGGSCQAVTAVEGPLKPDAPLKMDYKLVIRNGFVRNPEKKIDLSALAAEIFMDATGLRILESSFLVNKQSYSLDGFLPKDQKKRGHLNLSSKDMKLSADYSLAGQNAVIDRGNLEYAGLRSSFKGHLTNITDPSLDVDGDAELSLERMSQALVAQAPWLKNAGLEGSLKGYYQLKGQLNRPLDWDFKMDADGDLITVKKNVELKKFSAQIRMRNRVLNIPYLHTESYGGKTSGSVVFDLRPAKPTFEAKLGSTGLNIKPLAHALGNENKDLAGIAMFHVVLRGTLGVPESLKGSGSIDIQDGYLWKTDEFKQMGELPFVKVEGLDQVTFTSMSSIFSVRDKKVWTENLQLMSDTVHLSMRGTVSFDQTVDMLMDIHYSNDVFRGADDAGGLAPFMVSQAEGMISQYRLSGPLKAPKSEKIGKI